MSGGEKRRKHSLVPRPPRSSAPSALNAPTPRQAARYSATSSAAAGTAGTMYPGSFDCDALKNRIGTTIQIRRNRSQESSGLANASLAQPSRPHQPYALGDGCDQYDRPRHSGQREHRQVEPEGLRVVVDVRENRARLCSRMKKRKNSGLRNCTATYQGNITNEVEGNAGDPESARNGSPVALCGREENNDGGGQSRRDRAFG